MTEFCLKRTSALVVVNVRFTHSRSLSPRVQTSTSRKQQPFVIDTFLLSKMSEQVETHQI